MSVASSCELGKSEAITTLAGDLTVFVQQAARTGLSLDSVERSVLAQVLDMGKTAVDLFLSAQGDGDIGDRI